MEGQWVYQHGWLVVERHGLAWAGPVYTFLALLTYELSEVQL